MLYRTFLNQSTIHSLHNGDILNQLGATMTTFDLAIEILPGTIASRPIEELNDFEVGPVPVIHE